MFRKPVMTIANDNDTSSDGRAVRERDPTNEEEHAEEPPVERQFTTGEVYSVFTVNQKRSIILTVSMAAFFSPLSSSIYYPSLPTIALDLHVSNSQINLTVTTYLICFSNFL